MADQILSQAEVNAGAVRLLYHDNGDGSYSPVTLMGGGGMTKFTLEGINGKTVASSKIATTDPARAFIVTGVVIRCTAASAITIAASASVGTNSASFNNIIAATVLAGVTAANKAVSSDPSGSLTVLEAGIVIPPNTDIDIKITNAATGTSQTLGVDVLGYYP
jgi:hypothetical protein